MTSSGGVTKSTRAVDLETERGTHYGAITREEGLGGEGHSTSDSEQKRSTAVAGQDYQRIASRNKRAEHATT